MKLTDPTFEKVKSPLLFSYKIVAFKIKQCFRRFNAHNWLSVTFALAKKYVSKNFTFFFQRVINSITVPVAWASSRGRAKTFESRSIKRLFLLRNNSQFSNNKCSFTLTDFQNECEKKNVKFNLYIIKHTIQLMLYPSVDRNGRGGALRDEVGLPQLKKK